MNPLVVPTITADNSETYAHQIRAVEPFARRIHIDLMDGKFAPTKSIRPDQVWWPGNVRADLHVMFKKPFKFTDLFIALSPALVIVHAESKGSFGDFANAMHAHGIETGIALLPDTPVETIVPALDLIDHVLIFSGKLGYQGGSKADPSLVPKIKVLKQIKPSIEIGWDGGINEKNIAALAKNGVQVLNVGGYIHKSSNPTAAYKTLDSALVS